MSILRAFLYPLRRMVDVSVRCLTRPKAVLFVFAILLSCSLFSVQDLTLDNDPRTLAPISDIQEDANARFEESFGPDDNSVVVIISGDNPSTFLSSIASVTKHVQQESNIASVCSPAGITRHGIGPEGLQQQISPLFGTSGFGENPTEQIKAIQNWPGSSTLISTDGRHAFVTIQLKDELRDPIRAMVYLRDLDEELRSLVSRDVKVHIGGLVATRAASVQAIMTDSLILFPLSGLMVFLVTYWRFESIRFTLILLVTMNWSIVMTAGCVAFVEIPLTPLSQLFPILVMIIGIADGVHLLEALERAKGSMPKRWNIALRQTGSACYLTTCTTVVGFLSLLYTQIPILHDFAMILSLGIVFALLSNLFLLPAACLVFCPSPPRLCMTKAHLFGRIAVWSYRNGRKIMSCGSMLLFLCMYLCSTTQIDYFLTKILADDNRVTHGNQILEHHFGGAIPIEVSVFALQGDFHDQSNLKQLDRLSTFLAEQTGAVYSHSVAAKGLQEAMSGEFILPRTREESITITQAYQKMVPNAYLSSDQTHTRVSALTRDNGTKELLHLQESLRVFDAETPEIHLQMVGAMMGAAEGFESLVVELLVGLVGALCLIITVIGLYFRSMKLAFISVIPNSLPIMLGVAFFPCTGRHLDIFSAVFFTIALGISVDDTIHMLKHFTNSLQENKNVEETIVKTASEIGSAIANTSWILISGFVVLLLSEFPANRTTGGLVAGLISAAFVCDLIFVPAAISFFQWRNTS